MDDQKRQTREPTAFKKTKPIFLQVKQLSPASVGFNLHAKVGKITPIMRRLNLDGTHLRIYEARIGDETGCVLLSLRNAQIDMVNSGDVVILRNAKIDMVNNGFMRVAIDRWGLIQVVDTEQGVSEINAENDLSGVEYELVKEEDHSRMNNRGGRGGQMRGRGRGRGNRGRGGNRYFNNNNRGGGGGRGGVNRNYNNRRDNNNNYNNNRDNNNNFGGGGRRNNNYRDNNNNNNGGGGDGNNNNFGGGRGRGRGRGRNNQYRNQNQNQNRGGAGRGQRSPNQYNN